MDKSKERASAPLQEIGGWKRMNGTSAALYAGACTAQGWKPGRRLTEQEYDSAIAAFGGTAMDGRERNTKKEGAGC